MDMQTIWVIPPDNIKSLLTDEIVRLAKEFGGPIFEPHMTLVGDVPMKREEFLEKAREFAGGLSPFELALGEISFSTTYFQSVFVRVRSSARLMEANMRAKEIFQMPENVFMPHISLFYGDISMEKREEAAADTKLSPGLKFVADRIVIMQASRDITKWKQLEAIRIGDRVKEQ